MSRIRLVFLVMIAVGSLVGGCQGPTFTNLGNGVGVPSETIDDYARTNGIEREEARMRMREESDEQRGAAYAKKYGISVEDAKKQLEDAGE